MRLKERIDKFLGPELAVIVLIFSLLATYAAWRVISLNEQKAAQLRFDFYKQSFLTKLNGQMKEYQQALRGAAGLFYSSDNVTRSDWKHYVDTLNIGNAYPGIQGMGFALHVPDNKKNEHIDAVQKEGLDYQIYPPGQRDIYTPVLYLEPFDWRNQRALGYDLWSDSRHHEAMIRARDTGNMALTSKLILIQETFEDTQVGFMMFAPIYKKGGETDAQGERQNRIYGYVYSPFRMKNLMDAIGSTTGQYLEVEVYDGKEVKDYAFMYGSNPNGKISSQIEKKNQSDFMEIIPISVGEHDWTVVVKPGPAFNEYIREKESTYALVSGVVISFLLFTVAWSLSTSRQRAVKLADKMTGDLRVSEERYALAMAGSNDGLWDWNIMTDVLYLSPRFKKLLGYREEEVIGSREKLIQLMHPEDLQNTEEAFEAHLKNHIPLDVECRIQLRNREFNWFRIKGQAIWDKETQKPLRMAGSLSDINDRKLAALFLQKQKQELEMANKYKSEFLANMSHELRTPLNSIMVLSSLLSDKSNGLSDKQKEQASIIYRSGGELLDLISEILDLSKIEAGKMEILYDTLNLEDFGQEINMIFQPIAKDQGLIFSVDIDKNLPVSIMTDHKRLYQVVKNLASNAIKFTPQGEIKIRFFQPDNLQQIDSSLDPKDTLAISVSDTGIGIPEDKFALIFEAFKQVDGTTSRQHGGTGLGLTISREILTLLNGTIKVKSELGKGSCFTIYFPMNQAMKKKEDPIQPITSVPRHESHSIQSEEDKLNLRILLVDDDIRNIYALTALFETLGCEVKTAENGQEALDVLKNDSHFDVILMDMMMPVMDGYEATRQVKANPEWNPIPLIALTAKAMPEDREKCLKAGADAYIAKPVKNDELQTCIRGLIQIRKV